MGVSSREVIDRAWIETRTLREGYGVGVSNPLDSLCTGEYNCLSFALTHYALGQYALIGSPALAFFGSRNTKTREEHYLNVAFDPVKYLRLYDNCRKTHELFPWTEIRSTLTYCPESRAGLKKCLDFMRGIEPGTTPHGSSITLGDYKIAYLDPERVLSAVCRDEDITMSGLAEAVIGRLQSIQELQNQDRQI